MSTKDRSRNIRDVAAGSRRWTADELQRLRELWGLRSEQAIARELGRSIDSVRRAAVRVFEGRLRKGPWADDELERLRRQLGTTPLDVVAGVLGRQVDDVERKVDELRQMRRRGRWTREELSELRRIYGTRSDEDLSAIFGRSIDSVRRVAKRYALSKDKAFVRRVHGEASTRMPRWSEQELQTLRRLYAQTPNLEIAHAVGRSIKSVVSKAHQLGLKKDIERLREMGRENVAQRYGARRD